MHDIVPEPLEVALAAALNGDADISEGILRSLDQNDARVLFNLGWHDIRHGHLHEGMDKLNVGRLINVFGNPRIPGTIWKDEDLTNKTLLFRCEGGFGDQIMNFRFAYDFQKMGARVLISCARELMDLFARHGFICIDNEYVYGAHYDYWVPAMSAAYVLGYDYPQLSGAPYLTGSPIPLYKKPNTLKVGIKWSGRPEFEHEQHRRFDPNLMIDLHTIEGATFYCLQRDENLVDGLPFADMRDRMKTWEDTVSIIKSLDLVITSCTSVAHCAGALGVETWVVVPILPYYSWALPGDKSPWYDSVRLFRQTEYGTWEQPFADIREALRSKIAGYIQQPKMTEI